MTDLRHPTYFVKTESKVKFKIVIVGNWFSTTQVDTKKHFLPSLLLKYETKTE